MYIFKELARDGVTLTSTQYLAGEELAREDVNEVEAVAIALQWSRATRNEAVRTFRDDGNGPVPQFDIKAFR